MSTRTHRYTLYNLPVLSEIVLPELDSPMVFRQALDSSVIEGLKPVLIRRGPTLGTSDIEKKPWFTANGFEEARLRIGQVGEMIIKAGAEIEIRALPEVNEDLISVYLLGSAMGCILHQRGITPLHISTVSINGRAWAFTAPSGSGKSTLAARLHRFAQCSMVSDDVAALYWIDGQPYVAGGPPLMKLSPEFAVLFDDASITPVPHPESNKLRVQVKNSFIPGLVPLAGIVVLERDEGASQGGMEIQRMTGAEAFLGARGAIYRYQMGRALSSEAHMFEILAELPALVPFYKAQVGDWATNNFGTTEMGIIDRLASF